MAQRRHHYEKAFEDFLRARRIPYVAVDEARKALLPEAVSLRLIDPNGGPAQSLKSFDFVLYGESSNLLVEVKGRRVAARRHASRPGPAPSLLPHAPPPPRRTHLDTWVTAEDVESLTRWESLFGGGFEAAFVFVYWCDEQPPDALFEEIFEHRERWYAIRAVRLTSYAAAMKIRSPRWGTVHVPPRVFDQISGPLALASRPGPSTPPVPALDTLV